MRIDNTRLSARHRHRPMLRDGSRFLARNETQMCRKERPRNEWLRGNGEEKARGVTVSMFDVSVSLDSHSILSCSVRLLQNYIFYLSAPFGIFRTATNFTKKQLKAIEICSS